MILLRFVLVLAFMAIVNNVCGDNTTAYGDKGNLKSAIDRYEHYVVNRLRNRVVMYQSIIVDAMNLLAETFENSDNIYKDKCSNLEQSIEADNLDICGGFGTKDVVDEFFFQVRQQIITDVQSMFLNFEKSLRKLKKFTLASLAKH